MDNNRINEIKEKIGKATSREELKELFIQLKAEELKYITDPDEYAMRANEQRDFVEKQMQQDAIKAAEPIKNTYEPKPIKNTTETEEIKKHNR